MGCRALHSRSSCGAGALAAEPLAASSLLSTAGTADRPQSERCAALRSGRGRDSNPRPPHGRRRARTTGCRWKGGGASRGRSPNEEGEAKPRPLRRLRAVAVATAALPAGPGRAARAAVLAPGGGTGRDGTGRDGLRRRSVGTRRGRTGAALPRLPPRPAPRGPPAAPSSPLGPSGAGGGPAPPRPRPRLGGGVRPCPGICRAGRAWAAPRSDFVGNFPAAPGEG